MTSDSYLGKLSVLVSSEERSLIVYQSRIFLRHPSI